MKGLERFGPVWIASGGAGFFGEGYSYHRFAKIFGFTFKGVTFVAKTTTADKNLGNMPMKEDGITPKEFFPKCVYASPRSWLHGSALNAVSLSGPGIESLIMREKWQKRTKPFFISIMAIGQTPDDRRAEMRYFHGQIKNLLLGNPHLREILGIQINYSCPNTGHDLSELFDQLVFEAHSHLDLFGDFGIPLVPKLNILLPKEYAKAIGNHPACSGLTLSNTIPWDELPKFGISRKNIFGLEESPLIKRGFKQPGGYSGRELLPLVVDYVWSLRRIGFKKHVNAGGGILDSHGVDLLRGAGANTFSLGSITFLRPWKMEGTIRKAYKVTGIPYPV